MRALETQNLTKVYVRDVIGTEHGRVRIRFKNRRVAALKDLSLQVDEGEIFGLLGPNGAGKTTTIKILMGLIFPTRGSATILGKPLGDKSVKAQLGFLPENPYFYDYLKGWEFLNYYGQLYGVAKAGRRKKIEALLDLVGLTEAANLPLKGFSKGMLQRIGLAQALLNDPRIVFLDEPQSGLDPFGRKEIRDIILKLKERGKTVFFSSHILSDAEMICDRVGILFRGELINVGNLTELLSAKIKDYEIVAKNVPQAMLEECRKIADRCIVQQDEVMIIVKEALDAERLVKRIVDQVGTTLVSFVPRQETLEEYFIRQIERGNN
jgi:ABC-2 type transport system ATP-binding protein